jgi:hypothetical protein
VQGHCDNICSKVYMSVVESYSGSECKAQVSLGRARRNNGLLMNVMSGSTSLTWLCKMPSCRGQAEGRCYKEKI